MTPVFPGGTIPGSLSPGMEISKVFKLMNQSSQSIISSFLNFEKFLSRLSSSSRCILPKPCLEGV